MFDQDLAGYLAALEAWGISEETRRHRRGMVGQLLQHLAAQGITALAEVGKMHLDAYLVFLRDGYRTAQGRPLAISSFRLHHDCLRDFFAWLQQQGRILSSPYGLRQPPKRPWPPPLPTILTPEEAIRVMESVALHTAAGLRDRAILELLYSTGMRKRELVNLNVTDVSFERQEALIVNTKTKRDRVVPVGEFARHCVEAYRRLVRPWLAASEEEKALFLSTRKGRRVALRTVARIVERAVKKSGVNKRVTPRTLRHSMATHMLRNRADLRHIQAILGHAQLTSTTIYTQVSLEDLKEVLRRAHPHGKKR
jgi:integrase/recombinase XerD